MTRRRKAIVTKRQCVSELGPRSSTHNGGVDPPLGPLVFESCHSTWVFDSERMRFRRILKGIEVDDHRVATEWRSYYGLVVGEDSEAFTVLLNPEGTRMIRSWRHTRDCPECGEHMTAELSQADIEAALA
jgi:hypothetical protein